MEPKRLGLLRELAPNNPLFGALVNPNFPPVVRQLQQLEQAARAINQRLFIAKASTDQELDAAFASLKREGAGALLVAADPYSTRGANGSLRSPHSSDCPRSTSFANTRLRVDC